MNETDKQCAYDRTGLLCGGCQSELSLVLGSSQCKQCSNSCLSLLIVFAVAGIALVVLLLACNLTVAMGTINGLIFYANIIAVDRSVFFPSGDTNILTVFIAWLNLDLGIESCFYDGMEAYGRMWLQFVLIPYIRVGSNSHNHLPWPLLHVGCKVVGKESCCRISNTHPPLICQTPSYNHCFILCNLYTWSTLKDQR